MHHPEALSSGSSMRQERIRGIRRPSGHVPRLEIQPGVANVQQNQFRNRPSLHICRELCHAPGPRHVRNVSNQGIHPRTIFSVESGVLMLRQSHVSNFLLAHTKTTQLMETCQHVTNSSLAEVCCTFIQQSQRSGTLNFWTISSVVLI